MTNTLGASGHSDSRHGILRSRYSGLPPRVSSHLILDEERRKLGPIGHPKINDERLRLGWSENNLREVELGLIKRFNAIEELATHPDVEQCRQRPIATYAGHWEP